MMAMVAAKVYFSNNVMVQHWLSAARAIALLDHEGVIVPPDASLFELHAPSRVVLVPGELIFNINRAYIPRPRQPTRRGVYERDNGCCAYCERAISYQESTLDHIIPLSAGGASTWENLVNCCAPCNQRKGGRTPEQARMKLKVRPFTPKVRLRPE